MGTRQPALKTCRPKWNAQCLLFGKDPGDRVSLLSRLFGLSGTTFPLNTFSPALLSYHRPFPQPTPRKQFHGNPPLLITGILLLAPVAHSQDLGLMGGGIFNKEYSAGAAELTFSDRIEDHFLYSISYLNEGHLNEHHRDGIAPQIWAETSFSRFSFEIGAGPYLYFDTLEDKSIEHGVGGIASLDAKYFLTDNWFLSLGANAVFASTMNTEMVYAGVGYKFHPVAINDRYPGPNDGENQITMFLGGSIRNDHSGSDFAQMIEFRRSLAEHFDATVSLINEDERQGAAIQLWAVQRFGRLNFGIGAGPYETVGSGTSTHGIITGGAGYQIATNMEARVSWSRAIGDDTDIITTGIGYRF